MARRTFPPAHLSRTVPGNRRESTPIAAARFLQLQAKWDDLTADQLRNELRRIVAELPIYGFQNRAGPLEHSLPYLELAALSGFRYD